MFYLKNKVSSAGLHRLLTISINISDHVINFLRGRILPQSPHDNSDLIIGDKTAAIMIKEFECLAEIWFGTKQKTKQKQKQRKVSKYTQTNL